MQEFVKQCRKVSNKVKKCRKVHPYVGFRTFFTFLYRVLHFVTVNNNFLLFLHFFVFIYVLLLFLKNLEFANYFTISYIFLQYYTFFLTLRARNSNIADAYGLFRARSDKKYCSIQVRKMILDSCDCQPHTRPRIISFALVSKNTIYTFLHLITFFCISLQFFAFYYVFLQFITFFFISLHFFVFHYIFL